ncbi:MAG: DUF4215 domain-containing protein [Candidatus Peribacteria bacterium]|nr:MAG: DUF4215 domain-containing protein [Candidatus Peribacteria bacterium]
MFAQIPQDISIEKSVAATACITLEPQCGDGLPNGSDQCDDGNIVDGDGCDSLCMLETPTCTLTMTTPGILYPGSNVGYEISGVDTGWVAFDSLTYGDGNDESALSLNELIYTHAYLAGGTFVAELTVSNAASGALTATCSAEVTIADTIPFEKSSVIS